MNYISTKALEKVTARNMVSSEMSFSPPRPDPPRPPPPVFTGVLCFFSVFPYADTTKHTHTLYPYLFFFFLLKRERRLHTVLCFALSLPVSWRSFHFCTERASSFFFHCVPVYGWAILYLTRPQNDGHLGGFQALAVANRPQQAAWSRPCFAPCEVVGKLLKWSWWCPIALPQGFTGHTWTTGGECPLPLSPAHRQRVFSYCGTLANRKWKMAFQDNFSLHFSYKEVEYLFI